MLLNFDSLISLIEVNLKKKQRKALYMSIYHSISYKSDIFGKPKYPNS